MMHHAIMLAMLATPALADGKLDGTACSYRVEDREAGLAGEHAIPLRQVEWELVTLKAPGVAGKYVMARCKNKNADCIRGWRESRTTSIPHQITREKSWQGTYRIKVDDKRAAMELARYTKLVSLCITTSR